MQKLALLSLIIGIGLFMLLAIFVVAGIDPGTITLPSWKRSTQSEKRKHEALGRPSVKPKRELFGRSEPEQLQKPTKKPVPKSVPRTEPQYGIAADIKASLRRACLSGEAGACYQFGQMAASEGDAEAQNKYFKLACKYGARTACQQVGETELTRDNIEKGFELLGKQCHNGDPRTCFAVGNVARERGALEQAKKWYQISCERRYWQGCMSLAEVEEGRGNSQEAEKWYSAACHGGYVSACDILKKKSAHIRTETEEISSRVVATQFKEIASRLGGSLKTPGSQPKSLSAGELKWVSHRNLLEQARVMVYTRNGRAQGLRLFAVRKGSIIERMGLRTGDIILKVNGRAVLHESELLSVFRPPPNGSQHTVLVRRRQKEVLIKPRLSR